MFEKVKKQIENLFAKDKMTDSSGIKTPVTKLEQVIGQPKAVYAVKHAIKNRTHVLFIGQPGTGQSLLASNLSQQIFMKKKQILAKPNTYDPDKPFVYKKMSKSMYLLSRENI